MEALKREADTWSNHGNANLVSETKSEEEAIEPDAIEKAIKWTVYEEPCNVSLKSNKSGRYKSCNRIMMKESHSK